MNNLIFRQLFDQETSTYTYILGDKATGEAVIIDPVLEKVDRDLKLVKELGLELKYVLDTHVHADHITGAGLIRERVGAKTVVGKGAGIECADVLIEDDQELAFGSFRLKAISTPGHTDGCTSYFVGDRVFTGDTLFIRGSGRTDFQQGSSEKLYDSVHRKLYSLPDETLVFPGHDYKGQEVSSIGEERRFNPRLAETISRNDFLDIMKKLKLADPKKIHEAVPANQNCGILRQT